MVRANASSHSALSQGHFVQIEEQLTSRAAKHPRPGVRDSDQIKLTDEASRIMPVLGRGFEQCCNAQACVAANTMLVVAAILTQAPNDKCQVQPILNVLQAQTPQSVLGYRQFSLRGLRKFTVEWKADFEMPRPAGC